MHSLLHDGLERWGSTSPDRIAIVDEGRTLTYGQLESRANQLARLLLDLGLSRGDRVALFLNKSLEALIGIYGTLKAGGAYVPLDPQAPVARVSYIMRNCETRILLTGLEQEGTWIELASQGTPIEHLIVLNAEDVEVALPAPIHVVPGRAMGAYEPSRPTPGTTDQDLAYILYTSGSTGTPKGVMLSHLNGLSFVQWAAQEFNVQPQDRLSSHAPLHFDLSVFDVFAASSAGAAVVLVPPRASYFPIELARFIERNAITVWYSVPSILNMLVERGSLTKGQFPELRLILFAGEVFPSKYLRHLMLLLPHVRFCNLYGPTETNVCTWYDVASIPPEGASPIPIGRAIPGIEVFALTEGGRRARVGETGELYVRGPTVMRGYWGDPVKTSNSLVVDPLSNVTSDLVYRTGDLVQEQTDGDYHLLGRRDHQIKSRGNRIELGDIENALYAHPAIIECAVTAIPDPLVTNRIKAYVAVRGDVPQTELVEFCESRLPRYMIPESFEFRPSLPKTSTGKIDRTALADTAMGERPGGGRT